MPLDVINFSHVRNRNEKMVLAALETFLMSERGQSYQELLSIKDLQDIYALALNQLPARYAQSGTIVIGNPVRDFDARQAVMEAFETVLHHPKD